jgi:hypothetical protein
MRVEPGYQHQGVLFTCAAKRAPDLLAVLVHLLIGLSKIIN